jgi:hypothetical protein
MIHSFYHCVALKISHLCEYHLDLLGNLIRDRPALCDQITLNVIGHARRFRKIALCDRLALSAAELFH